MAIHTFTIKVDVKAKSKHERAMLTDAVKNSLVGYEIPGLTGSAAVKSVQ